jgi:hypothetical protein
MAVYKVPTDILEACKKELTILSSRFKPSEVKGKITKSKFQTFIDKKSRSKVRAKKLIKLLEDNYGV